MVYLYTPLFAIIHYYDTIMTLIALIAISSLFAVVEVAFSEKNKSRYGPLTEGIMLAKNPSGVITSCGP